MGFANLYCHSDYQFGDSCVIPSDYAHRAKSLGYSAVAVADYMSLKSFPSFFEACKEEGIKGIGGAELKLLGETGTKNCVFLIENEDGYRNLCKIISLKKDGYYPDDLKGLAQGLLPVFPSSSFTRQSLERDAAYFVTFSKVLGDLWLGIDIRAKGEEPQIKAIHDFASSHSYRTVAFPLVRYLGKRGKFIIDVINSDLENKALTPEQINGQDVGGPDFLLSPKVLEEIYPAEDIKEAGRIADLCNFDLFSTKRGRLLSFTGTNEGDKEAFVAKTHEGMKKRGLEGKKAYEDRLAMETKVIIEMGYASYFLIVSDYVMFAKNNGIKVGPGRGSACGSLVSFLLGITEVDPLEFDLSFERFLNPKRVTMPDIDMDFEDDRRDEITNYLKNKYGPFRVAQIVTYQTYKTRSAIKSAAHALGMPDNRITGLVRYISPKIGSIREALERSSDFRRQYEDPYYRKAIELAKHLEGLPVNTSIHAAGVILADKDIYEQVPLSDGKVGIVQYEYPEMERLGFLKVDLLSLHYLTLLKEIEGRIKSDGKEIPDCQSQRDDPETYKTINSLDLLLVFQLDGEGIKKAIAQIRPERFSDLVALLALYRPGPMENIPTYAQRKHTGKIPSSGYPKLDEILKDTYGIIIYQEQILKIAHQIAGMDMSEADLLRRAISKKDETKLAAYRNDFITGAIKNGLTDKAAQGIYDLILKFANYGFNKSHSVAYAFITFAMAYLKTHFAKEFYEVALGEISSSAPAFRDLAKELQHRGLRLKPISVNTSDYDDLIDDGNVYLGLKRTKAFPDKLAQSIPLERKKGPFKSLGDFLIRLFKVAPLDERMIKGLSDSGALDCFGFNRESISAKAADLANFAAISISESALPALDSKPVIGLERIKEFIRELQYNGVSLAFSLKDIVGPYYREHHSIGIVVEEPYSSRGDSIVTLANAFGTMSFILPSSYKVNLYDIITFIPIRPYRFGRIWGMADIKIVSNEEGGKK